MIHLYIHPTGIERVVIESASTIEEDFDHAAWCAIRRLVGRIDGILGQAAVAATAGLAVAPCTTKKTGSTEA